MSILAVDLAAKFSAACWMDENYQVIAEFDSWGRTEEEFLYLVIDPWLYPQRDDLVRPDRLVIEDLPHGLNYTKLVKSVCRLQGRIVQAMHEAFLGTVEDVLFLAPNTWRAHYPQATRGTGADISLTIAEGYGYQPPADLLTRAKGNGGKTRAHKVATDYCAAYLIARWAIDTRRHFGHLDVPGTSRYGHSPILKKDFDAESSNADV